MGNKGINVRSPIACRELPLKSLSSLMANMTLSVRVLGAIEKYICVPGEQGTQQQQKPEDFLPPHLASLGK